MITIAKGLDLLEKLMHDASPSSQPEFDIIYDGLEKHIDELRAIFADIDARLRTPIC
jgi:hypothetical protein